MSAGNSPPPPAGFAMNAHLPPSDAPPSDPADALALPITLTRRERELLRRAVALLYAHVSIFELADGAEALADELVALRDHLNMAHTEALTDLTLTELALSQLTHDEHLSHEQRVALDALYQRTRARLDAWKHGGTPR